MFNLANQLTLARIFFVVPIILLLYFPGKITCFLAAVLFGIASLTDFLDGHIARKGNMVTSFGKFLDPLADKLLICSILIMFVELGWVPAWVTIIIIGRELAVTGLRAMALDEGRRRHCSGQIRQSQNRHADHRHHSSLAPLSAFGRKRAFDWKFSALHCPCAHDIFRPELLL